MGGAVGGGLGGPGAVATAAQSPAPFSALAGMRGGSYQPNVAQLSHIQGSRPPMPQARPPMAAPPMPRPRPQQMQAPMPRPRPQTQPRSPVTQFNDDQYSLPTQHQTSDVTAPPSPLKTSGGPDAFGVNRRPVSTVEPPQVPETSAQEFLSERYSGFNPKNELGAHIVRTAQQLGIDPVDLGTVISYETAGTFDPWKKGRTTKWGEHRGLIQWGGPQRKKYGVTKDMSVGEQMDAVARYLTDAGVKPGATRTHIYSAINAGNAAPKYWGRTDKHAGGAPGSVLDKVRTQMAGHEKKALRLLGASTQAADTRLGPVNFERPQNVVYTNQGATRSKPLVPDLELAIGEAISSVYGDGYTAKVYSGGQPEKGSGGARVGSTRHDHGNAADIYIYDPEGRRLTGDDLGPIAQYWLATGRGGVGLEMKGGGIHLDLHTDRAPTWTYGELTPGQRAAVEAGLAAAGVDLPASPVMQASYSPPSPIQASVPQVAQAANNEQDPLSLALASMGEALPGAMAEMAETPPVTPLEPMQLVDHTNQDTRPLIGAAPQVFSGQDIMPAMGPQQTAPRVEPPPQAIAYLEINPETADEFDEMYGPGMAQKYLA